MIVRITFITALINALLIGLNGCTSNSSSPEAGKWATVIRDLQVVMVSGLADSVKQQEIQKIFQSYQLTIEDYHEFYSSMIQENPQNNLQILKEVEKLISEDMKAQAKIQRKRADEQRATLP